MGPSQCSKELLCFHKKPARLETTAQSLKKRPRCLFFFANFCLFLSSDLSYLLLTDRLVSKARWSVNVTQKDQMLANVDQQGQCGTILTNVGQCLPILTNVEQFWPMSANNVDQCWTTPWWVSFLTSDHFHPAAMAAFYIVLCSAILTQCHKLFQWKGGLGIRHPFLCTKVIWEVKFKC